MSSSSQSVGLFASVDASKAGKGCGTEALPSLTGLSDDGARGGPSAGVRTGGEESRELDDFIARLEALEAEADGEKRMKKKWGASVGDDVDENAERVESAKAAACSAIFGTALSAPLLLSGSLSRR